MMAEIILTELIIIALFATGFGFMVYLTITSVSDIETAICITFATLIAIIGVSVFKHIENLHRKLIKYKIEEKYKQ